MKLEDSAVVFITSVPAPHRQSGLLLCPQPSVGRHGECSRPLPLPRGNNEEVETAPSQTAPRRSFAGRWSSWTESPLGDSGTQAVGLLLIKLCLVGVQRRLLVFAIGLAGLGSRWLVVTIVAPAPRAEAELDSAGS